ncbi:TPA: prepilin peptidase [Citrobacter braakii]|jgi:Flp pilus assembly protein protease CpaA|uniref:Prepilin type IV endopeptidase peptidase domain-containing protein n=1 Tax=Citrobacter braakii TaxID=57706 RepID=A0A1V8NWG7_CITBR|nr:MULTISPECIES: prepilin peptidase [Citrobacter]OCF82817.1 hypothetical protein AS299_21045 [Citrobacter freundii]EGT5657370.1 hypothetical protein [Citrobacter braakii]MBJ8997149.1 prepilin peptidase [Citrobacter braakii]MBS6004954.1 prepilin peptidase [Citrobacter sp.]MDM3453741.1 prepilin peptidase [Citrobacter sp. Cb028]
MILYILIVLTSIYIMWMDIRYRRIPNKALVVLLFIGFAYLLGLDESNCYVRGGYIIPAITLSCGIALSYKNIIGMGDVKFLFLTLLLCPEQWHIAILYVVIFIGGCWSLLWHFVLCKIPPLGKVDMIKKGIPYGIPIALALCTFTFIG